MHDRYLEVSRNAQYQKCLTINIDLPSLEITVPLYTAVTLYFCIYAGVNAISQHSSNVPYRRKQKLQEIQRYSGTVISNDGRPSLEITLPLYRCISCSFCFRRYGTFDECWLMALTPA